jgi:hypothetical protein
MSRRYSLSSSAVGYPYLAFLRLYASTRVGGVRRSKMGKTGKEMTTLRRDGRIFRDAKRWWQDYTCTILWLTTCAVLTALTIVAQSHG